MKIILIFFLAVLLSLVIYIIFSSECKPNCSGAFCGNSDSCGGTCECKNNGKCINGVCCYPSCDGIKWGDDGCGGTCACDRLPCTDSSGQNCHRTVSVECSENNKEHCTGPCVQGKCDVNTCCYPQDCNNVFCGDDGCGGTCGCQAGSVCSEPKGGICINDGTSGYVYNIIDSNGVQRTNVSSPKECAAWIPENIQLNLSSFPCNSYKDCPDGQNLFNECSGGKDCVCVADKSGKKYCNRNNVYQWWYYDPSDSSGFNCTKIREGSTVCSLPKAGASAFDIAGNISADKAVCSNTCAISPICPSSGTGSCCPGSFSQKGDTAECVNATGDSCCLNNPSLDYASCIASGKVSCEKMAGAWWEGNLGEIANGVCGLSVTGPSIHVNSTTLQNSAFDKPCENKNPGDACMYNDGSTSFSGLCKTCMTGGMKCLPDITCTRVYSSAAQPGICTSKNLCG